MGQGHTPGPWYVETGSVYAGGGVDRVRIALADRNEPKTRPVERDVNAHLIAAAPDLLEAARAALLLETDDDNNTAACHAETERLLRAAIEKAEGGPA